MKYKPIVYYIQRVDESIHVCMSSNLIFFSVNLEYTCIWDFSLRIYRVGHDPAPFFIIIWFSTQFYILTSFQNFGLCRTFVVSHICWGAKLLAIICLDLDWFTHVHVCTSQLNFQSRLPGLCSSFPVITLENKVNKYHQYFDIKVGIIWNMLLLKELIIICGNLVAQSFASQGFQCSISLMQTLDCLQLGKIWRPIQTNVLYIFCDNMCCTKK